jgi:hypothetical protein
MAKDIREDVLRVRNFCKDVAEKNLTQIERLIGDAEKNVKRTEQALGEFKVLIVEESDRLYKKVIERKVKKLSVDVLNVILRALKNKLFDYEKNVKMKQKIWESNKKSCRKENSSTGSPW